MPSDNFTGTGDHFGAVVPDPELEQFELEAIKRRQLSSQQRLVDDMEALLKQDMLSIDEQERILEAMSPSAQRTLVARISGLDASVLMTVKRQIQIVDAVLRRIVNEDGTSKPTASDYDMPLKEALNMSMKVTQMIVKDLPKVYTIERIQKQEEALRRVMEKFLSPQQQEAMLEELEKVEQGN